MMSILNLAWNVIIRNMLLKQITNLQKHSSLLDLRKIPHCESSPSTEPFSCYFKSIFEASYNSIESLSYPYSGPEDPLFGARSKQVEWIFSLQTPLGLGDDTIFQAILLLDKYISLKGAAPQQMNKLAASCLIISSKANEIYPIKLFKLNQISKQCYSNSEFVELEMEILSLIDFNLPHGTVHELFRLYQVMFKLDSILKKDSTMFVLQKCVLDYDLLQYGVKATSLAAISYLSRLKKVLINTAVVTQSCRQYPKALWRINQLIKGAKQPRQTPNPQSREYINI